MISVIKLLQTNCVQCANLQMNKYLKKLDYVCLACTFYDNESLEERYLVFTAGLDILISFILPSQIDHHYQPLSTLM